jgi:hypothetical protein
VSVRLWEIEHAWSTASAIAAAAWKIDPGLIRAPSRGRGPRPPEEAREPKKVAISLAVTLAGCDYAELAKHLALHKDTVTSHCASVRERCAADRSFELIVQQLEDEARAQLRFGAFEALAASRARTASLEAAIREEIAKHIEAGATLHPSLHPTEILPFIRPENGASDHEIVRRRGRR